MSLTIETMNNPYKTPEEFYTHVDDCSGSVDTDRVRDTIVALTEARAEVERLQKQLGDKAQLSSEERSRAYPAMNPATMAGFRLAAGDAMRDSLRTVAERQREACARAMNPLHVSRWHAADVCRATPLVTDEAEEKHKP